MGLNYCFHFFRYTPRVVIAGSYSDSIFSFLRNSLMFAIMAVSVYIPLRLYVDLLQPWLWIILLILTDFSKSCSICGCSLICSSVEGGTHCLPYSAILTSLFMFLVFIVIGKVCAEGQSQAKQVLPWSVWACTSHCTFMKTF